MTKEILNYAADGINNLISAESEPYAGDLHHELFNTDYFIIGRYDATRWLENNVGVFQAIDEIKEYEMNNFGEVNTDLSSPEAVCNMYVYIKGEELLNESKSLMNNWDKNLTKENLEQILTELK